MTFRQRRLMIGSLVAAAVLAAGGVTIYAIQSQHALEIRDLAIGSATGARDRAVEAIRQRLAQVESRAQAAASLNPVRAMVLGRVDSATLRDAFLGEYWWQPFREQFVVQVLDVPGRGGGLHVGPKIPVDELVKVARQRRPAKRLVTFEDEVYVAAAAPVDAAVRNLPPAVIVLADRLSLTDIAARANVALILTAGNETLAIAGPQIEQDVLNDQREQLLGSKAPFVSSDGEWAAASKEVTEGVLLTCLVATNTSVGAVRQSSSMTALVIGVLAVLVAAAGFFLSLLLGGGSRPNQDVSGEFDSTMVVESVDEVDIRPITSETQSFGRYHVVARLGEGGMGVIDIAEMFGAEGFRRLFVLKRLNVKLSSSPEAVNQFIDEARLCASLIHSNIIPVFDFGKVGDEYFMAQEYILGRDLQRVVRKCMEVQGGPLPVPLVVHVMQEVLSALEYAHSKEDKTGKPLGLVHRDISPANIMISARGEVKLLDFGIFKAEGRVSETQDGVVKGNLKYMSPEQSKGIPVDCRSDFFSLGHVMFYALTGETLYKGSGTLELLIRASEGLVESDMARIDRLPAKIADILKKAMAMNPADRFQDASEFTTALSALGTGARTADLAKAMETLMGEELRTEEQRLDRRRA